MKKDKGQKKKRNVRCEENFFSLRGAQRKEKNAQRAENKTRELLEISKETRQKMEEEKERGTDLRKQN